MTIDALFDRMRHAPFGATDPNVTQHQAAIGDGNIQPAAFLANVPATVVIDDTGLAITDGKLTVTNAGSVVIIDGTSNIFKIVATGTHTTASFTNPGSDTVTTTLSTGLTFVPGHLVFLEFSSGTSSYQTYYAVIDPGGHVFDYYESLCVLYNTNQTQIKSKKSSTRGTGTSGALQFRYFVLKEVAF